MSVTCIRRGVCYNFLGQPVSLSSQQYVATLSNQDQNVVCCGSDTPIPPTPVSSVDIWRYAPDTSIPGLNTVQLETTNPNYDPLASLVFPTTTGEGASTRLVFDTTNAAWRAGIVSGVQWDQSNRGRASVAMGENTTASGQQSVVGGGINNQATSVFSTVSGGANNAATGVGATIGGGSNNAVSADLATIGGGTSCSIALGADRATISGGEQNTIGATGLLGTIGGGSGNSANANWATVGGGQSNSASGDESTIAGGSNHITTGVRSTIGGGTFNRAIAFHATVGGGENNQATADSATIAGGSTNQASGFGSTVSGGLNNLAGGDRAAVIGGQGCSATGSFSIVGGSQANDSNFGGCFIFSDATNATFASAVNQFVIGSAGGATFFSNAARSVGVNLPAGGNAWAAVCDRKLKENFQPLNATQVLDKVAQLPLYAYNMIGADPTMTYMGPFAQDWHQLFPSGKDPLRIDTTDLTGVALAAIQGLLATVGELKQRLAALEVATHE